MKAGYNTGREEMAARMLEFAATEFYAASVAAGYVIKDYEYSGHTITIRFKKADQKED